MNEGTPTTPQVATLQPIPLRVKLKSVPVKNRPILEPGMIERVDRIIVQYAEARIWKEWGLESIRSQGACALFEGPPGTGKTMAAKYLGHKLGRPVEYVDLGSFGSKEPGANERQIDIIFRNASSQKKTIILDECESILCDRSKLSADNQWMISTINKLLVNIELYKYLIILATNLPQKLDPALFRRLIARLQFDRPSRPTREKIWKMKMPDKFPLKLSQAQFEQLSEHDLTGSEIQTAIIQCAQQAIFEETMPTFQGLLASCSQQNEG